MSATSVAVKSATETAGKIVVDRYADGRKRSLLRSLVPFTLPGFSGPVAGAFRAGFIEYPQLIEQMFKELETLDTAQKPREQFAEAMQNILAGDVRQSELRKQMYACHTLFQQEVAGQFDQDRMYYDPQYKLNTMQLMAAARYYSRYLDISPDPGVVAKHEIQIWYQSEFQKNPTVRDVVKVIEEPANREILTPIYHRFFADLCMLERDVLGEWRFDVRGGHQYFFNNIKLEWIGVSEASASLVDTPILRQYLNYETEMRPVRDGRWQEMTIRPGVEDYRAINGPDSPLPKDLQKIAVEELVTTEWANINYNCPLGYRTAVADQRDVVKFEVPVIRKPRGLLEKWFNRGIWSV